MKTPDRWIVVKITGFEMPLYKVFATWYGGYLGSDSWKMNSGIVDVEVPLENTYVDFIGYSGSRYRCQIGCYGTSMYSQGVLNEILEKVPEGFRIDIMPEDTNWSNLLNDE